MAHPPPPEDLDVLPRLWHRAATTANPDDKALLLEAANIIKDLRDLFGGAEGLDDETAYRLGVRMKWVDPKVSE